jgi:glycosyltransferase involved in cell wall biosynthesis
MRLTEDMDSRSPEPSIAIIVPVYNGSKHLGETLESALKQNLPARDVIVIEDGSPHPSRHIVDAYAGVMYIAQQNSGVSRSRNHGASLTTAEWLCFLDQDDILLPQHLEQLAEQIRANPAADLHYTPRLLLSEGPGGWITSPADPLPSAKELPKELLLRCVFPPSGVCIRKSTFDAAGGFLSKYDLAEDWELWLRMMMQGHVFHGGPQATLCYRVHGESNSHRPIPIMAANLRVIQQRILPSLSWWGRVWTGRKLISRQEAEAGILLRQLGQHGGLKLLLKSIFRFPFCDLRRYKIAGHMLILGTREARQTPPASQRAASLR